MVQPVDSFLSSIRDIGEEGYEFLLRKPLFLLGEQSSRVRKMFLGLRRRQSVTIYAGVLWVIPIAMFNPYTNLFMVKMGLSKSEVGIYQSLMNLVSLVGFFLGGYLSDAWGRKKTLILFDIISWGGYCLCMSLSDGKWWCVWALFFLAINAGSTAPYQCLLAEGVPSKQRASVYTVLQLVNLAPFLLFFPLVGGLWESKRGLVDACHEMFWFLTFMIAIGIYLRWRFLPESRPIEKTPESWSHVLRDGLRQYRDVLKRFFKKPASVAFLMSKFLDEWMIWAWGVYSSLYFVQYLGLKESYLSILSQGSGYVVFLVLFLVIPNILEKQMIRILGLDQIFGFAAIGVLLFLGQGSENVLLVGFLSSSLGAIGGAFYASVSASVWMNIIEEKERAKVVSATFALIKIGLLTGMIGALLYGDVSPMFLLYLMMGMRVLNYFLLRRISKSLAAAH